MTHIESVIYFDNAATSWPKPKAVGEAMVRALEFGGNPGRGAHRMALDTSRAIFEERRRIAGFLGVKESKNVLFQPGATQAMNLVLRGSLKPGDVVLVAATEHNSVTRPLHQLAAQGVEVIYLPSDDWGVVDLDAAEREVQSHAPAAIVCQHASNLTGAIQPIADLVDLARESGCRILVDGAQAGGHIEVGLEKLDVDAWACSGHKGLLGPQGIGLLYLKPGFDVEPLVFGGTGSGGRDGTDQPFARPDVYEAGTQALPLILGLGAAVEFISQNHRRLIDDEQSLTTMLHEGLGSIQGVRVLGPVLGVPRVPLVSIVVEGVPSDQVAYELDTRWGVACRAGLHCAPAAHDAVGTGISGAVRFGVGPFNTRADVETVIDAVETLVRESRG